MSEVTETEPTVIVPVDEHSEVSDEHDEDVVLEPEPVVLEPEPVDLGEDEPDEDDEQQGDPDDVPVDPPDPESASDRFRKSNRSLRYVCSVCDREVGKDNLKVKRVQFKGMGVYGRIEKSRVTEWLCVVPQDDGSPSCLDADPAWASPKHAGSPGMADTRLAVGASDS